MTQADISSGRLVFNVGLATIKPSEFEILRFDKQLLHQKKLNNEKDPGSPHLVIARHSSCPVWAEGWP